MQTVSMLRTNALVSSSRQCSNRQYFQPHFAPAVALRSRAVLTRAEADNTGGSITNSVQTKGKDSYEVCLLSDSASDHYCEMNSLTRLCKAVLQCVYVCWWRGYCSTVLLWHRCSALLIQRLDVC